MRYGGIRSGLGIGGRSQPCAGYLFNRVSGKLFCTGSMRLLEFYFHATGNLRRGNPAREAGFSGFGAALCWELCPRCCRLPAARKSRLTFRQAGAAGMQNHAGPPPRIGQFEADGMPPAASRPGCERLPGAALPRLAWAALLSIWIWVTGVEPFRFYCARRSRKPEGYPPASEAKPVGPRSGRPVGNPTPWSALARNQWGRKRQAGRNPTPWSALAPEPVEPRSGKPEGTPRRGSALARGTSGAGKQQAGEPPRRGAR